MKPELRNKLYSLTLSLLLTLLLPVCALATQESDHAEPTPAVAQMDDGPTINTPEEPTSETSESSRPFATVVLYFENDLFYDTDKYYTNAVQIRFISPALNTLADNHILPDFMDDLLESTESIQKNAVQYHLSTGLGQIIYTPEDTDTRLLQKDDRPYAAQLYGFLAIHAKRHDMMDTAEVRLGIVGPSALGEQAQNETHRFRGFETAKGWQHQLKDEPTLDLTWTRNYRLNDNAVNSGWNWDALPYHSLTAGNSLTQAAVGCEVRFGYNLSGSFSSSQIRHGSGIDAPLPEDRRHEKLANFGCYIFAGTEGRAIARNIFLDGNTWKDSHSIDKKYFVGSVNAGLAVVYNDIRLAYNHVYQTEEFRGQDKGQQFGSITLSFSF